MASPDLCPAPARHSHRCGLIIAAATLIVYGILAVLRHSHTLIWDEGRYLVYAHRLTEGWYVPDKDPDFVNGPGYPILLMPFVNGPGAWLWARLLNAVLMAGAAWFVWLTARQYAGRAWAAVSAAVVAFHPTLLWMGFSLMTEPLAVFCLTGFMACFCTALRGPRRSWRALAGAGFFLGWLILTRVFFGHVIFATGAFCLLAWPFLPLWRQALQRALLILAVAFLMCVPYLTHTWQKTGQILCWSTNSGELLYWMTSHHPGENGHWFSTQDAQHFSPVAANHADFYRKVLAMPVLEREAAFKAKALEQLKADPKAVAFNWVCNLSRLAFGFPRSFLTEELRTVILIFVNGPLIILASLAGILGLLRWRTVPPEIWLLAIFAAVYLGGSSLAPGLPRYFVLVAPILLLATGTVFQRHVKLQLASRES